MPPDFAVFGVYQLSCHQNHSKQYYNNRSKVQLQIGIRLIRDIGTKGLIFLVILKPDDTFFDKLVMWVSHARNSSISTPKHLLQLTLFREIPLRDCSLIISRSGLEEN